MPSTTTTRSTLGWVGKVFFCKASLAQRDVPQGTIQAFEFTHELAWNVLRDYLVWQGIESLSGSRDAIREAFKRDLIVDGGAWLSILQDRNRTVHSYNEETANQILAQLRLVYAGLFIEFRRKFQQLADNARYSMENDDV